jgi:hypothetical protein
MFRARTWSALLLVSAGPGRSRRNLVNDMNRNLVLVQS